MLQDDELVDALAVLHLPYDHLEGFVTILRHVNFDVILFEHAFQRDLLNHVVICDQHLPLSGLD